MVTILRQGELVLYSHTAWAEDADGGGFSLTESEDALYIGSYIDSLEAESEDPEKYTWTPLSETGETDESAYDDVIGEMMDSMENMEGDIITASELIEGTQNTSDIGLGNLNELVGTNHGTDGWTGTDGLLLQAVTGTIYLETDDPVSYLSVTCMEEGDNYIAFQAEQLRSKLADDTEDNAYTFSCDVNMSTLFEIRIVAVQDPDGQYRQLLFDAVDNSPAEDQDEIDMNGVWVHQSSTAEVINEEEEPVPESEQVFYMDLSEMPEGAVLLIANLKVEGGALATPWRMSNDEIESAAREALQTANSVQERADSGEFDGEDAVLLRIDSSRGNVFKNSAVETVLTVNIIKAGETIRTASRMREVFGAGAVIRWYWKKLGEDTFHIILDTDSMISDEGFTLTLTSDKVDTKVTFQCELDY